MIWLAHALWRDGHVYGEVSHRLLVQCDCDSRRSSWKRGCIPQERIKRTLDDLEADRQAYAGQPEWDEWVNSRRGPVELLIRMSGFTLDDVMKQPMWPTLGTYLRLKSGVTPSTISSS